MKSPLFLIAVLLFGYAIIAAINMPTIPEPRLHWDAGITNVSIAATTTNKIDWVLSTTVCVTNNSIPWLIENIKRAGAITNLINALIADGTFCAVHGHTWAWPISGNVLCTYPPDFI